jgi:hypothetical protein
MVTVKCARSSLGQAGRASGVYLSVGW